MEKKRLQDVTDYKVMSFKEACRSLDWDITENEFLTNGDRYAISCNCGHSKIEYRSSFGVKAARCNNCGKHIVNLVFAIQTEFQTESYLFEECEKDDEGNDRFWIATDKAGNLNRVRNISTRVIPKAAFIQKPLDEGITIEEITELVGRLECEQVIPIEVQANSSCALGFISLDAAEELNYDYDNLIRSVSEVIEDMDNETEYGNYDFDGFPVYIGY